MTDKEKLDAVVTELRRRIALFSGLSEDTVNPNRIDEDRQILSFIDSMQEEPTTSVWHDKSEKPKMNSIIVMNNDQTTLSVEYVGQSLCGVDRWAYLDNLLKL